ncbi:MFS transporter [Hamadaea tsunoensis]|uniref:MFS transporter n=1 Tax=Hamadaea tsunoensis TaxID=53368 RepID=UPI00041FFD4F|nr:MFS transporter [Hamadaea tsunoensis]
MSRITPEDGAKSAPGPEERSATYREVLANGEYRTIFGASLLSWVGDYFAKAAITALVFAETGSPALSAAAFALSYAPWLIAGPLLATLAERYRYRTVMITCDLVRMTLIALVAVPGMPLWAMLTLLFLASLASPPAQAAKSAMLPQILPGDQLTVGLALNLTSGQAAQVGGYLIGGLVAAVNPRGALAFDAATFALSALLLITWVQSRPPAGSTRRHLLRETSDGFRLVFGTATLRSIALVVFGASVFSTVPEGLGAAWAAWLHPANASTQGVWQGLIMMANPVGQVVGALLLTRLFSPARRRSLIIPFSLAVPAVLIPSLLEPRFAVVCLMAFATGFFVSGMVPTSNSLFVRVLPDGYRARAFGVMQMGVQLTQGIGIFAAGLLADRIALPLAVGVWSVLGLLVMICIALAWPSRETFDQALAARSPAQPPAQPAASPSPRAGALSQGA